MGISYVDTMLIIAVLLLALVLGLYFFGSKKNGRNKNRHKHQKSKINHKTSSDTVSRKEYEKVLSERDQYKAKYETLKSNRAADDCENARKKGMVEEEIKAYQKKIRKLEDENHKLINKIKEIESLPQKDSVATMVEDKNSIKESPKGDSKEESNESTIKTEVKETVQSAKEEENVPAQEETAESNEGKENVETPKEMTMFASFPRSAGTRTYFSDLSEKRNDDSYFELVISNVTGKATFKPLDFMKIRNYDPAMYAILTDGVKPNVASSVIGMEPGTAHIEGNDWIIDNLAKIKLA